MRRRAESLADRVCVGLVPTMMQSVPARAYTVHKGAESGTCEGEDNTYYHTRASCPRPVDPTRRLTCTTRKGEKHGRVSAQTTEFGFDAYCGQTVVDGCDDHRPSDPDETCRSQSC